MLTLFFSNFSSAAAPIPAPGDLLPFINFLRTAPAFISGTVYFNADSVLFDDGWTQVKLLANKPIEFTFSENYLEVRAEDAFYIKSYKLRVYVSSVKWTPSSGVTSKSKAPADITGLSSGFVSGKVNEALAKLFEAKLVRANNLLKRIRVQPSFGSIFEIAKAIVKIFTSASDTGGISLPKYRGEIGLNLMPKKEQAFNLYGMRVGIHELDFYNTSFEFTGDNNGIYPHAVKLTSRDGVDINYGKEYKIAARLILKNVRLDSRGTEIEMHLGASQLMQGVLSAIEQAARLREPGVKCPKCQEAASFPAIRLKIEKQVREAIVSQVDDLWPMIRTLNINPQVYTLFKKREACRVTSLTCMQQCNSRSNSDHDQMICKSECTSTLNACMK